MFEINELKSELFDSLTRNPRVSDLIHITYRFLQRPLWAHDSDGNLLGYAPDYPIGYKMYDTVISEGSFPYTYHKYFKENLAYQYTADATSPVFLNQLDYEERPHLYSPILDKNNAVTGGVTFFYEKNEKPVKEEYSAATILARAIYTCLQSEVSYADQKDFLLFSTLFSDQIDPQNVRSVAGDFGIDPDTRKCIICAHLDKSALKSSGAINFIVKHIKNHIPYVKIKRQNDMLLILLHNLDQNSLKSSISSNETIQYITGYLCKENFKVGISQIFQELADSKYHRDQASFALETGEETDPDKNIYTFDEYVNHFLVRQLQISGAERVWMHPVINILWKYDKIKHSDYLGTLLQYVTNDLNLSKSAKALNIHKTTLSYRLEKIQELYPIDLDNQHIRTQLLLAKYFKRTL